MFRSLACFVLAALAACGPRESTTVGTGSGVASSTATAAPPAERSVVLSIVGTNDLHGRVHALPLFAGYVANLREARRADGGVLLVDAGDMFQGTLESNLLEGRPVRDAYAALGYAAVTVGNHEFDFGPAGPRSTPKSAEEDPRGALKALAKDAPFPFLIANVADKGSGKRVDWPNMPATTMVEIAGVRVGLIGISTAGTMETTISSNVSDLTMLPAKDVVLAEAAALRAKGAQAVVVLAHAGGKCKSFTNPTDHEHCETDAEIFRLARALPKGTVDAIVAGHSHAGVAHEVNGIPIIEQFSYGRSLGRVDIVFGGTPLVAQRHTIFPPRDLCPGQDKPSFETCDPGVYEGKPVVRDAAVAKAIEPGVTAAKDKRLASVGPELPGPIHRAYNAESALGNLFADLILEGVPKADVALMNGGGLREDLPAGRLPYGALFESFPFDNQMATAEVKAGDLKKLLAAHLGEGGGILSVAGIRVRARCNAKVVEVSLERAATGKPIKDDETLLLVASDFMLLGGDNFWQSVKPPQITVKDEYVRDILEKGLAKRKTVREAEVLDAKKKRMDFEGVRPVRCK